MKLSPGEEAVLRAVAQGGTLKTHRSMDGEKLSRLHPLDAPAFDVDPAVVESLKRRKLIRSNMKFPAATYLLTDRGRIVASDLTDSDAGPLGPRNYAAD